MYYKASGTAIADGYANVDIVSFENTYIIKYQYKVDVGHYVKIPFTNKKVLIGDTYKGGQSFKVDKKLLTEKYVREHGTIEIKGLLLNKISENIFRFEKGIANGNIIFSFDGLDPVEIDKVHVNIWGISTEFTCQ